MKTPARKTAADTSASNYAGLVDGIGELLEAARRASARAVAGRQIRDDVSDF